MDGTAAPARLREHPWRRRYRTKAHDAEGRPTDILREFYLPALACAERYDRVAGYFSSSSLAVASQGFTALARRGGKARLIVGADLDLADVAAALAGEEVRLAGRLLPALDLDGAAEPVRRGVMLLAWLVAQGAMQLRVALRVHARTREPLPFDSVEDGYVHEKWGVIADGCGDRLYFTGSLNESRTALVLNAENLDVHGSWQGEDALHRVAEAEQDFARLWADEDRGLRVLPLPEAVRLRLIAVAERLRHPVEIDGTAGDAAGAPPPSPEERLRFAVIRNAPRMPGGRWVGMATAPVAPWPHQEIVARRLVETFPLSWLLCDEVGLGKTIEAGLAIRSLVLAGLARRVLIAAPASLTRQWQRELATKFLLDFGRALGGAPRHVHILGEEREVAAASIYAPPLTIVSTGLLAREDRQAELAAAEPWDLVLVDEAHYARRKNPQAGVRGAAEFGRLYRTIETLRTRTKALWLATATPMQLDPIEAWDLMRLTRRVGSFGEDAPTTLRVYELLGRLAAGETLEDDEDELLRRMVLEVQRLDPPLWAWIEETVIDGASRRAVRQWLDDGRRPRGRDGDGLRRLVFAAAPLSRVMLRHTRSLLEEYRARGELKARLARRNLLRLQPITLSDQERRVYDALEDYGEGLADRLGRRLAANRARGAVQFYLSFLRLRFASSLHAIRQTLARRLQRVEAALDHVAASINDERGIETLDDLLDDADDDRPEEELLLQGRAEADLRWERDRLRALLAELADIAAMPSKMTELLKALDRRRRGNRLAQTVVFTRFADTMEDIVGRLRALDSSMLIGTYSGAGGRCTDADARQLVPVEREEVKHRFRRGEIDVLVCTDAAAEGLNLQSADLLVNFDLPWNPMKVEQRIGRIDRIGQAHDKIFVLNLAYAGSAEEIVYDRLLKRLAEAQLVVGTQQLALLPVTPEEFAELACRGVDEAKIAEIEREARKRAERQRARSRAMELSAEEQYGIYRRLAHRERAEALPADLDGIWRTLTESEHLRALGCRLAGTDPIRSQILLIDGIPGLPPSALTADRDLIERGIPDLDRQLRFAAHGERVFDAVLAHLTSFEAPPAVHWAEIPLDSGCSAVACVAAPAGGAPPLLIEGLASLDGWTLAAATPAEAAMTEPVTGLRRRLAQQPGPFWAACRIEAANRVASFSQAAFVHAVMAGLIACEQGAGRGHEVFTRELRRLEGLLGSDRGQLYVKIAADLARRLQCELFDFRPPGTGTDFTFTAPRWLLLGGIDTAWQLAASAKRKDGDLATHDMLRRLRQKAEQFAAELRA